MNELLEAKKAALQNEMSELMERVDIHKKRLQKRQKLEFTSNTFVSGACFGLFIIGLRDASYIVAAFQFFMFMFFAWRAAFEWKFIKWEYIKNENNSA